MAIIETWFNQDLQKPVKVQYIDGSLFSNNGNGNRIGVNVFDNGEPVTLTGSVSGYAVLSDGTTVPCTGTRSGNKASILVPPAAYVPGALFLSIFLTDGTTVTTLGAVSTSVLLARTDTQVDPGTVVADWTQTINGAMQDVQTAAENLGQIVATPYPSLTYPVPLGKYTYYNGNLYRCVSPIASSENFTPAHWTSVNLGDEVSDLKSAINYYGHPCIKEIYVFDDYDIDMLLNASSSKFQFANAEGTAITAKAIVNNSSPFIPIVENKLNPATLGWMLVDWDIFVTGIFSYILPKTIYDLAFSPSISAMLSGYQGKIDEINYEIGKINYYGHPAIKEIYIYDKTYDVKVLNQTSSSKIEFANEAKTAVTAKALVDLTTSMIPIVETVTATTGNRIGWMVVDWGQYTNKVISYTLPTAVFVLDCSPAIKQQISESGTSEQITSLYNSLATLGSNLDTEETARETADNALSSRIDNLIGSTIPEGVTEVVDARTDVAGTVHAALKARLDSDFVKFNKILNRIRTVGAGQAYQTIQSAVDASSNGDVIIIFPGTYYEAVTFPRKNLYLIGTNRDDVVLQYDNNDYDDPPLEMIQGVLMNMTVRAFDNGGTIDPDKGKAYALHCDFQSWGIQGGMLYCENVKFISENFRTIGMGLRGQGHMEFVNCEIVCLSEYEALLFHDAEKTTSPVTDISNQSVSFKNCTFVNDSDTTHTIEAWSQEKQSKVATVEWQRNIVVNKGNGGLLAMNTPAGRPIIDGNGWMGSSDYVLKETSAMNTTSDMNYTA